MATSRFLDNAAYRESCRFILEAHAKRARGESSLPETDAEHDRMTATWFDLCSEEKARLKGLSADLHMLRDQEVVLQRAPAEGAGEGLGKRLAEAVQSKNWEEALVLLRCGLPFLSRDQIALLRGLAWQNLGHDDVALLFFEYSGTLKPENAKAEVLQLRTLLKLGRFEEARQRSEEYASAVVSSLSGSVLAAG